MSTDPALSLEGFRNYLRQTLIPDLRASGMDATADDFEVALDYMPTRPATPRTLAEKVAALDEAGDQLYGAVEALIHDYESAYELDTQPVREAMAEFSRIRTEVNE